MLPPVTDHPELRAKSEAVADTTGLGAQEAFVLVAAGEISDDEIATEIGRSESRVRFLKSRLRHKHRKVADLKATVEVFEDVPIEHLHGA